MSTSAEEVSIHAVSPELTFGAEAIGGRLAEGGFATSARAEPSRKCKHHKRSCPEAPQRRHESLLKRAGRSKVPGFREPFTLRTEISGRLQGSIWDEIVWRHERTGRNPRSPQSPCGPVESRCARFESRWVRFNSSARLFERLAQDNPDQFGHRPTQTACRQARSNGQTNSRRMALYFEIDTSGNSRGGVLRHWGDRRRIANLWAIGLTPPRDARPRKQAGPLVWLVSAHPGFWQRLFRVAPLPRRRAWTCRRNWHGAAVCGLRFTAARHECQRFPSRPDDFWRSARIVYHLVLITLLVAATSTDLRDYVIPDQITLPGMIIGLSAAVFSGQLQLEHVWVDWNQEVPGIAGPYIPDWLDAHRHWHGLAWSLAGGLVGAGLTWFVRGVSALILSREALGFGDVTLMAMIGTFIGWQPIVFVFGLAPFCGLAFTFAAAHSYAKSLAPLRPFPGRRDSDGPLFVAMAVASTRLVFGHAARAWHF